MNERADLHDGPRLDWVFSEAQRLSDIVHARTQRATFNVITGFLAILAPAAVALTKTLDVRLYLAAPVLLSALPLAMLEEDRETRAIARRLALLEARVNRACPGLMISELVAERRKSVWFGLLFSRLAMYGYFVLLWLGVWTAGFLIAVQRMTTWFLALYAIVCAALLGVALVSALTLNAIADRVKQPID